MLKEGAGLPETIAQMESNVLKFFQPWYKLNLRIVGLSLLAMSVGERSISLAVAKRSSAYSGEVSIGEHSCCYGP